jgi:hypothetical protein
MTAPRVLLLVAATGVALGLGVCARAETPSIDPSIGHVEIWADLPNEPPFVGEPIMLHVRSSLRAKTTRDKIFQPALTDFDWQQFGIDTSTEEMLNGFWTPVVERVLMITPLKAGALTIPPFTRRVEVLVANGERVEANFVSNSLVIDVRSHDGVGSADDWWLPAKSVTISDKWEPAPERIPFGETAHRVLTIEAKGLTADRLPPPPVLRAPGLISFIGPVDRQTIVTDDGPVARASYSWKVRPVSVTSATAPAIHIPWFDVATRKMRDAAAPEREVAFLNAMRKARIRSTTTAAPGNLGVWPLAAFFMSFAWTLGVTYLMAASRSLGGNRLGLFGAKPPDRTLDATVGTGPIRDFYHLRRRRSSASAGDP